MASGCRVEVCQSKDTILSNATIKKLLGAGKTAGVLGQLTEVSPLLPNCLGRWYAGTSLQAAWEARRSQRVCSALPQPPGPVYCSLLLSLSLPPLLQDWGDELFSALREAGGKVYSNYAVGYNNVDVEAATKNGIAVGNTPGRPQLQKCDQRRTGRDSRTCVRPV